MHRRRREPMVGSTMRGPVFRDTDPRSSALRLCVGQSCSVQAPGVPKGSTGSTVPFECVDRYVLLAACVSLHPARGPCRLPVRWHSIRDRGGFVIPLPAALPGAMVFPVPQVRSSTGFHRSGGNILRRCRSIPRVRGECLTKPVGLAAAIRCSMGRSCVRLPACRAFQSV